MNFFTFNSDSSSIKLSIINTEIGHKAFSGTLSQRSLIGGGPFESQPHRNEHEG